MDIDALAGDGPLDREAALRAAIIRTCGLSEADMERITRHQTRRLTTVGEAAVQLGLASQADVKRCSALVHLPRGRRSGAAPSSELIIAHQSRHPHSEQIRSLRTELLLRHREPVDANMLAVLSPGAAEGRSLLAAELAISFAQLGQSTLLVDADMRQPRQHQLFGTENDQGLSHTLGQRQRPRLQEVAGLPDLSLLCAGPATPHALDLLSDNWFAVLVREWSQSFECVVFDTPPGSRYADGLVVATVVGQVLSLSRAKHTSFKDNRHLLQRLASTRSRVVGAVINYF